MRVLALVLVVSCFSFGARAEEDPWLGVFADHYELGGYRYETKAELVVALRKAKNREVLWLRWSAYASETAKLAAIEARIKEATQAAKEAGIAQVREISAEVF